MKNDVYAGLNIMQRHQMVNGFANDVIRKLGRETITKQREREIYEEGIKQGVNTAMFAFMRILWTKWGKCNRKASRLKVAFELFCEVVQMVGENPDEIQFAVEDEFKKQTGCDINRSEAK